MDMVDSIMIMVTIMKAIGKRIKNMVRAKLPGQTDPPTKVIMLKI